MSNDSNLTELETRLSGLEGEMVRQELQLQLAAIEQRLRNQILKGLPRSEFEDWQQTADAVTAAQQVLCDFPAASQNR